MPIKIIKSAAAKSTLTHPQLIALASGLNKQSSFDDIVKVIRETAKAELGATAKDFVLRAIHDGTNANIKSLRQDLATLERELGLGGRDKALILAQRLLDKHFQGGKHLLRSPDGTFWKFATRLWVPASEDWLCGLLLKEAKGMVSSGLTPLVSNALKLLSHQLASDEDLLGLADDPSPVVNCANGEVWLDKAGQPELRPHKPESYLTSCLPISFDPSATCPIYDKAVSQIFDNATAPDHMVRHWHEVSGYAIQPLRDIPCFCLLIGDGANGKTKLLQTKQRLLGPDAVYNGPIAKFLRDRFNVAALAGKLLFVDDDMALDTHLDDGLLKTISEAKDLTTRHAYGRHSFKFRCLALPVMAGNHYPSTSDSSHGLRRRAMVIPFDRKFGPQEADKDLFPKIWATELPGILNRALEGLARLRKRGDFELPIDCERAAHDFMAHSIPLLAFIKDECEEAPEGYIFLDEFWPALVAWAAEQGIKKLPPRKRLKAQLEALGYEVKLVGGYNRVNGLKLKALASAAD
jgi:putative DNA primase/helicase